MMTNDENASVSIYGTGGGKKRRKESSGLSARFVSA
jgi:hypothetical protein